MQAVENKELKEEKIEITPQMIEAGESVYLDFDLLYDSTEEMVRNLYLAMEREKNRQS